MVRSATRRGTRRPELRQGLLIHARRLYGSFPTTGLAEHLVHLQDGAVALSTESMFFAHYHGIGPEAADAYVHQADPDNVRRWLLDEDDVVTELDPAPCQRRLCQCPPHLKTTRSPS